MAVRSFLLAVYLCSCFVQTVALESSALHASSLRPGSHKKSLKGHPGKKSSQSLHRSGAKSQHHAPPKHQHLTMVKQDPAPPAVLQTPAASVLSGVQGPLNQLLVNNLGGMGPVPAAFPGMVFGGVFTTLNGTLVDLVVRNDSKYEPRDVKQTHVPKNSGFTSINVRSGTSVVLNCTFIDRMTALPVTIDRFALSITDLNSQSDVRKMVVAKPSYFMAAPSTTLTIATGSDAGVVFASTSQKTTNSKPKDPMQMDQLYQDNGVELVYTQVSSFVLTLQTEIPKPTSSLFSGPPSSTGRNFLMAGPSILEATAIPINSSAINQSEMIAAGRGLGGPPIPALPVQKMPNASELANATAAGVVPTGLPPVPATTLPAQPVPYVAGVTPLPGVAAVAPVAGVVPSAPVAPCAPTAPMAKQAPVESSPMLEPIPAGTPKPGSDFVMCATEWSNQQAGCVECTMSPDCLCNGQVTFGYDQYWTAWQPVRGVITCSVDTFGDPYVGHGKVCLCSPVALADKDGYWSGATTLGTWWPLAAVLVPAAVLACLLGLFNIVSAGVPNFGAASLQAAVPAALVAPMIAALFITVAKRGEYAVNDFALLQEIREATGMVGSPRMGEGDWDDVSLAIKVCAIAFVVQLFFRVVYEIVGLNERLHAAAYGRPGRERVWGILHHACTFVMYAAIVYIFVGLFRMGDMHFKTAVLCTIVLSAVFFGCYIVLHLFTFFSVNLYGKALMKLGCLNMNFAPMIALIYLGAQIGADGLTGRSVPHYAEIWMKVCTATVIVQTILSMITPPLAGAVLKEDESGKEDLVMRRGPVLMILSIARWVLMAIQYAGVAILCTCIWELSGGDHLAQALTVLTMIYFAIYAMMWLAMTLHHLAEGQLGTTIRVLTALTHLATLCPIAGALVLGYWVTS